MKHLNNLIEQDHRSIKLRLGPMLGFKRFRHVAIAIAGVELMHLIRKGRFALSRFIPILTDQNPCAQSRNPMDMMRHGWSMSLFQAAQQ
ncbi:DDE-type integrase/transposase/recombinase [Methylosinus sp. C49]|uniref:DDE-type integrase/transposase/recombinase n=1 Tax=Methylosinus sp. C49 TaxID=2699395 RepID=UPI0032B88037